MVVLGWFVLELTDSALMVALAMALRMLPNLLVGIPAGAIADAMDRRRLLQVLSLAKVVPAAAIGMLIAFDSAELWELLALTIVGGGLTTFYQTAKASFVYDIVGPELAVQGLTMINLARRLGGVVGPIAAGIITERLGADVAFFVLAGIHVLTAATMLLVRSRGQAAPLRGRSAWESLQGFATEIRSNRALLALGISTASLEVLGFSHMVILPSLARDVMGLGAEGLGLMSGIRSLGGVVGIVLLAAHPGVKRKGLLYLGAIFLFGGCLVSLGFAPNILLVLLILAVVNAAMALTDILSQSLMQLSVPNELRGRAMGSWVLAIGMGPLGSLQMGALASLAGVAFALSFNGVGLMALAFALGVFIPRMRRM